MWVKKWAWMDSNHRKPKLPELQSGGFNHSPTHPKIKRLKNLNLYLRMKFLSHPIVTVPQEMGLLQNYTQYLWIYGDVLSMLQIVLLYP
jgi:hypothetical protein